MRTILFISFILALHVSSYGQRTGCVSGNCTDGYGTYVWASGDKYTGEWKGGVREGFGVYYYTGNIIYMGAFKSDTRDGYGVCTWPSGNRYAGDWKSGKKTGQGVYWYSDGTVKSGQYNEDEFKNSTYNSGCVSGNCDNGWGVYVWGQDTKWAGDKYEGNWSGGKMSGNGTYYYSSGSKYLGNYYNNRFDGQGVYYWKNGDRYEGGWKEGKKDGYGKYYYYDTGELKTGYWVSDSYSGTSSGNLSSTTNYSNSSEGCMSGDCDNGYGVYVFSSGEKYEGYWVNKMRNGSGTNYFTSGAKYTGNWKDDKKSGYGVYEYQSSSKYQKYIGNYVEDKMTGQGTLYYRDGTKESGNWKDNIFQGSYATTDNNYNYSKNSTGCIAGNCNNGYGVYKFSNGDRYAGEWNNGNREGQGVYFYNSGVVYVGNFKNNNLSGYGYCKWTDNSYYIGDWADGSINGQGSYFYADGTNDIGQWRDTKFQNSEFRSGCVSGDCKDGYGTYIWAKDGNSVGQKYMGYWKGGYRNGQGVYYYEDGSKYVGNFVDNSITGQGTFYWPSGNKYEGDWIKSKMDGYGTFFYAEDATTETGYWNNGKFVGTTSNDYTKSNYSKNNTSGATSGCISGNCNDGYGVYLWPNGEKYEGNWKNDQRNGQGTNYFNTGAVHTGMWKNDLKDGFGTYTYKKESMYEKYVGEFIQDKMTGRGELYYRDGGSYKGYFKDNLFDGEGTFSHADGKIEKGMWQKDVFIGTGGSNSTNNLSTGINLNSGNTGSNNKIYNTSGTGNSTIKDAVDTGIPESMNKNPYRFALIFGNEDYSSYQEGLKSEVNVDFAERDARIFKEYATRTFGIPDENVIMKINAKAMEMRKELNKINLLIKSSNGKAEVFFYYAGHGIPEESTKEPYLLPVDVGGTDLEFAVKLSEVYKKLSEYPSKKVTVFLDACFSGGARNQPVVNARGVKIKPRDSDIKGNLVVFTSSSGEQSSMAYKDAEHGMFTYFLLKKLKETQGNVTYKEMSEYLKEQVGMKSVLVNNKEQTPHTLVSPDASGSWTNWKIKE